MGDFMENLDIPKHIAIIMDGNRRWAKKRLMPIVAGHRAGAEALRKIVEHCDEIRVKFLTVYAFSTENWKRSKEEVTDLMNLIREYLDKIESDNSGKNIKVNIIGDRNRLDYDIQQKILRLEKKTEQKTGLIFNIALNYGGRDEIINAIKRITKEFKNKDIEELDEEEFSKFLYTKESPDPDLIIRTAGEERLSNFLLWQSAYSEFFFSEVLWPDFTAKNLDDAIEEFLKRNRNFGGK
jgi:undecaprenyl diphosphate synthase